MERLTVALPKGRMLEPAKELFERIAQSDLDLSEQSRKLTYCDPTGRWRFMLAKATDVPVYVEYGAADVGIVGLDVLREANSDVYAPLPLGFGKCRMVVAAPRTHSRRNLRLESNLRVASKYPRIAREHFLKQGISVEVIALSGSIELAPAVGLSDLLVDIVQTGTTLRENDLVVLEDIMVSEAYLIVNRASFVLRDTEIKSMIQGMASLMELNTQGREDS